MNVSDQKLPEFLNPPLTEVAISVQFEPLKGLVVPQIGLLWQHYGKKFPHVEQHSPIDPVIERLGGRSDSKLPSIQLIQGQPLPRVWFLDAEKKELLQIQQDRFIRNWRKINNEDRYPRYEDYIRRKFTDDLSDFENFISENGIGDIKPNQCEVTYINHIETNEVWSDHADIGKVFTYWEKDFLKNTLYEVEDARFQVRQLLRNDSGEFLGRLHMSCEPAFAASKEQLPLFELRLVARMRPHDKTVDGVMCSIDLCRESIVRSFSTITRKEMHDIWNREKPSSAA